MVKKVLFITANVGIEHAALTEPLEALKAAEIDVIHATAHRSDFETVEDNIKPAFRYPSEYDFNDINIHDYAALVLPGGIANANELRIHPQVIEWLKHFSDSGKIIAVTGHAAWSLINAERAQGKTISSYANIGLDLQNAGAILSDSQVHLCIANNWTLISTDAVDDFEDFSQQLITLLTE